MTVTATVEVAKTRVAAPVVTLDKDSVTAGTTTVAEAQAALGDDTGLDIVTTWTNDESTTLDDSDPIAADTYTVVITITLQEGYDWPESFEDSSVNVGNVTGFTESSTVSVDGDSVTVTIANETVA